MAQAAAIIDLGTKGVVMFTAIIPFVMALAGGALYVFAANPKLQEIGRLILAAGVFALAFALSSYKWSL